MILKTAANMQEHGYIETGKEGGYYEVDGQRTEIGGGGDSRFSTCEVDVSFKLNGEQVIPRFAELNAEIDYIPGAYLPENVKYHATAIVNSKTPAIKPLLFNGETTIHTGGCVMNETNYLLTDPVVTGDISVITSEGPGTKILVKGNGTISFALVEG